MGSLGARVDDAARHSFSGRRRELTRLLDLMRRPESLPRVVQVHGPAGIGKSTLLQMWRAECGRQGLGDVAIVDSHEFPHTLVALTNLLAQRLGSWPPSGSAPVGIAIDSFDDMADMEWRFREGFLRQLEGPVVVVLAGRGRGSLVEPAPTWPRPASPTRARRTTSSGSPAAIRWRWRWPPTCGRSSASATWRPARRPA